MVLILPALFAASVWFKRASERGYDRVRDGIANVLADLSESLHGVRIVTAHNRQRHNVIHHRNVVGDYRDANNYTARINAIYGPGTQLLGVLGQAVLLAIGGNMVVHHTLTIGALVAFFLYLNRFFQPIQLLVQQYNTYQQGQASVNKLRDLVDTEPEVREAPDAVELPPIEGAIVFDDVSFGYDSRPAGHRGRRPAGRPGRDGGLRRARPAPASRPWPSWSPASTTPPPGGSSSTGTTCATSPCTPCAASSGWSPRSRSSSPAPSGTTSPSPGPTPPTRRSTRRWTRSA